MRYFAHFFLILMVSFSFSCSGDDPDPITKDGPFQISELAGTWEATQGFFGGETMNVDLRVEGHEDDVLWFSISRYDPYSACPDDETYTAQVTAFGLAVADAMLEEMGWVDQHPGQVEREEF